MHPIPPPARKSTQRWTKSLAWRIPQHHTEKLEMNATSKMTGAALAAAAAALFATASTGTAVAADEATVKCAGVNSCKGSGACKTAKNDCAGKNGCKGQGWVKATEKECTAKGGSVVKG